MPRIKSAKKSLRKSRELRLRNQSNESRTKTAIRAARAVIDTKPGEAASSVRAACRIIDRAVSKGVLHRNAAARKKSRLMRRAQKAAA